ncbi:MAG: GTP 3',8-cyclase MoaA [Candidatus Bathyarchaeota archaeon]|nr:GTP 3',8-cyclase MoaA [Candidatus Bathyarchaeota archaeon]
MDLQTNKPVYAESPGLCDTYGRCLNNLRISVTQRCNLNCFFCHREGENVFGQELTPKEIADIVKMACELGMTKVKITGGEPLLRGDIVEIVSRIVLHAEEVSLTTNGVLLEGKAEALRSAGLQRVNVSLHAMDPLTFKRVTGHEGLRQVERGIAAALENHLDPVKVNMVVLKGINDHEIHQMIDFTGHVGAILQLIEFQPVQNDNWNPWNRFHCDLSAIEGWLEEKAYKTQERVMHRRKKYYLKRNSGVACVEVVKPMHNSEFCRNCTRLRVTSDGKLKPCLLRNDNLVDAVTYVRGRKNLEGLEKAFRKVVTLREPYWKDVEAE